MSYPEITATDVEAEFVFRNCISITIRGEMFASISEEAISGDGTTFMRFPASKQIEEARVGLPDSTSVYHYRLVFLGELIDILCCKAPEVNVRGLHVSG